MRALVLVAALAVAGPLSAADPPVRVLEHTGRWESGYGVQFYNVVGRLRNASGHALAYVKLRLEALDKRGKVVASTDAYNESAEGLSVPDVTPEAKAAMRARLKPIPPDGEERFRGSFLKDETPAFETYRVRVVDAPPAKGS